MRKFNRFGLMLVASFALMSCGVATSPPASSGTVATPAQPSPIIADLELGVEKALNAAELAYNGAAHAYVAADSKALLKPEVKDKIKPVLVELYGKLQLARSAARVGNALKLIALKRDIEAGAGVIRSLIPVSN